MATGAWAALVAGASLVGFLDALYFVLVTYRLLKPDAPWLPRFCRMDEATCPSIVDTRYARVLGVPNALLGLAWYWSAGAFGLAALWGGAPSMCLPFLAAGLATVALSAYLAWALVARLHLACSLCFLGHGLNALILAGIAGVCGWLP